MDDAKPWNGTSIGGSLPVPSVQDLAGRRDERPQPNTAVDLRLDAPASEEQEEQVPVVFDLAGPRKRKRIKLGRRRATSHTLFVRFDL
jgi:hypothetical protein